MRVAHIIKATRVSGAETHLIDLLNGLRERDIDVRAFMLVERDKPMDEMMRRASARGIPISRLTIRRDFDLPLLWRLGRAIRAYSPDLAHTHLIHADLYGFLAARGAGVKRVVSSRHNDDAFRQRSRWRWINRKLWSKLDAGIAISHAIEKFAIEIEGAPAEKISVVHYGKAFTWLSDDDVNVARRDLRAELGLAEDAPLLGMVCRLVEQKGVPYALEALRRVGGEFPGAHLVIAGDGEKAAELRRLAAALGVADRVHWLGWRQDALDLMAAFDVLLAPSLWEGFGLVLLEAMSRRLPVIASRVSAIPEVVRHGETGYLIEPRDVDALAKAIARLLRDRALCKHMGLLGAARLEERFSIARQVDGTLAVYENVLR